MVGDIRQCGYIIGIELVQDRKTRQPYPLASRIGHQVAMEARAQGLLIRPIGNMLIVVPHLTMTPKELRAIINILKQAIQTVFRAQ